MRKWQTLAVDGRQSGSVSGLGACEVKYIILTGALLTFLLPDAALAQAVSLDLGSLGQAGATSKLIQLTALMTVLSLAPSILVMMTAFTRIVIVLSLLRNALSVQNTPPNTVLIG